MERTPEVSAFVLAGGKSTRMGADKALLEFEGRTLLERALEVVRKVVSDVRIVGAMERFRSYGAVVEDLFRECGPLGGIHAALRSSLADWNLMLAVDMPRVTPELVRFLVTQAGLAREAMAVVPRCAGRMQPLCALYRRELCDPAQAALRAGRNQIGLLLEEVPLRMIEEEELVGAGFSARLFENVNTPEELERARCDRSF